MPIPAAGARLVHLTARDQVYETLCDWIVEGTLQPNEKLNDSALAKLFGVSRTPVREAMQMLAAKNFVRIVPGKESRVTPIDWEDARQVYEMLALLHSSALSLAFPRLGKAERAELHRLNEELRAALAQNDTPHARELDEAFHAVVLRRAGNQYIFTLSHALELHSRRVENYYYARHGLAASSPDEHQKFLDALAAGDFHAAQHALWYNWQHFREMLRQLAEEESPTV